MGTHSVLGESKDVENVSAKRNCSSGCRCDVGLFRQSGSIRRLVCARKHGALGVSGDFSCF